MNDLSVFVYHYIYFADCGCRQQRVSASESSRRVHVYFPGKNINTGVSRIPGNENGERAARTFLLFKEDREKKMDKRFR